MKNMSFTWSNKPSTGALIKIATINEITSNANTVINCGHYASNKNSVCSNYSNNAHKGVACTGHCSYSLERGYCGHYIGSNSKCRRRGG